MLYFYQLSGTKRVILFEPHNNEQLYEAHIPQATLSYRYNAVNDSHMFRRKTLEESTSMVMSPVDMLHPDLKVRFCYFCCFYLCTLYWHRCSDALYLQMTLFYQITVNPFETEI